MRPSELKQFSLLVEFSEEDREALAELLEERDLPNRKSVFREGSEGEGLVFLVEGQLLLKSRRTGSVVGALEAPEHLGAGSLFSVGKREVTALADGPCKVWILPRAGLSRLLDDSPRAAFRIAEAIAGEFVGLMRIGIDHVPREDLD